MKYKNFDLSNYNSYRVRSRVVEAFFPTNLDELLQILIDIPSAVIIGGGNNIILSKSYYDKPFVFIRNNFSSYKIDKSCCKVMAGMQMSMLSMILADHGLTGFETFYDIPGSVGGGIVMNAGARDSFLCDNLKDVECLDLDSNKIYSFTNQECRFDYRKSIFKENKNLIITSATFCFGDGLPSDIWTKMRDLKSVRVQKQPRDYPSAGSVFKRPEGHFVGPMIQNLGLKGFSVGGAQVSEKHAGFIINKGGATGEDILSLIKYIQEKVKINYGVELELEQLII